MIGALYWYSQCTHPSHLPLWPPPCSPSQSEDLNAQTVRLNEAVEQTRAMHLWLAQVWLTHYLAPTLAPIWPLSNLSTMHLWLAQVRRGSAWAVSLGRPFVM